MAPKDLDRLIEKYLAGNCTKAERDFIDTWYASLGNREFTPRSTDPDLASTANRILGRLEERTGAPQRRPRLYYSAIAASVLISLSVVYYYFSASAETQVPAATGIASAPAAIYFENTTAAPMRSILPDGSIVLISPQSTIRYLTTANSGPRELCLEGEAYFDVARDVGRPFYVYTGNVITRVLGTSFIVRNRGGHEKISVSVKTGKVTVYSRKAAHKKTVLTPNQEAVYDEVADILATQPAHGQQAEQAKKHTTEMHFDETPIPDVFTVLMKTYDIDIVFPEKKLAQCVLTSSFYEEGLYDRIDVICTAIGATYKVVESQIVIDSKGCNIKTDSL